MFVRIINNEDAIEKFLTTNSNFSYKNVSVNWAMDIGEGYLFQYGTLIAKRVGTTVYVNSKFYSNTTSKLQNLIKQMADSKGYIVKNTEFMDEGGMANELYNLNDNLTFASKTFNKTFENLVKENLRNGMICINKLTKIIGKQPEYPRQIVGTIVLEKCFLKPYYKI